MAERPGVLVTRPAGQAAGLCSALLAFGFDPVSIPALEITATEDSSSLDTLVGSLEQYQLAVFVSANAVQYGLTYILDRRSWPQQTAVATVGLATTAAIEGLGQRVDYVPEHEYSSEGLLALPALQDMHGQRVVILRGNGGRETLRAELLARGAHVDYLEVYRRRVPAHGAAELLARLQQHALVAVTVTSNETLQNLFDMAGSAGQPLLREVPLVVATRRQAALAARLGFRQGAVIAGHASDEAMAASVRQLCNGNVGNGH